MTRRRKDVPKQPLPIGKPEPLKEWVDRLAKDPELAERFVTRWQNALARFQLDLFAKDPPKSVADTIEAEDRRFRTRKEEDGFSFLESAPLLVAWCDRHPRIKVDPSPILRLATIAPNLWIPADSVIAVARARGRRPQAIWYRVDADDRELEQVFS